MSSKPPPASILYTGGARSGKSTRAQAVAEGLGSKRLFIATAQPLDEEMSRRIARHQLDRGEGWATIEEPLDLTGVITRMASGSDVVLVDCLTLWLANLLGAGWNDEEISRGIEDLSQSVKACDTHVILVSNEVGMGIVPADPQTRAYRDALGSINQRLAAVCDTVVFLAAGLPLMLKGEEPR